MTNDKAREFFSAFHEGTLEPGLKASLERQLRSDANLQSEFAAFVGTVESLEALRREAIEIPSYLGERIAARLDPVLDAKRVPFWEALLAPFKAGPTTPRYGWAMGVAGALLFAAFGLRGLRVSGTSQANVLTDGGEAVRWVQNETGVVATFSPAGAHKVGVSIDGGDAQDYRVGAGQAFELTLSNPNPGARRFAVDLGDGTAATVVVPGTRPVARHAGSGTVVEFASALADAYRFPVVVKGLSSKTPVRWSFESSDARVAAEGGLDGHGNATMMDGNVLQIGQ